MRRAALALSVLGALTILAGLGSGTAAAGTKKLVEGTVYDTTCVDTGECGAPCPPPCGGPIVASRSRTDLACTGVEQRIVCPLRQSRREPPSPDFCLQGLPCGVSYPVYSEQDAVVIVRSHGSDSPLAELPVLEGHFHIRLAPGRYSVRIHLPDPACWVSDPPLHLDITGNLRSPVPATIEVVDACLVHPHLKP